MGFWESEVEAWKKDLERRIEQEIKEEMFAKEKMKGFVYGLAIGFTTALVICNFWIWIFRS